MTSSNSQAMTSSNSQTCTIARDQPISNYEGDEVDHEDGDGDGAGLGGGVDGDSGEGMEKTSGGDSGGISPLRSSPAVAFYLSVSGLVFLRRLPLEKRWGTFLIGIFRSRGCFWPKDRCKWGHEDQLGWAHAAW